MPDHNQHEAPNSDDATGMAFAEIPFVPAASTLSRPAGRKRPLVVSAFVVAAVIGMVVAYLSRPTTTTAQP